jgi:hypothetical protein
MDSAADRVANKDHPVEIKRRGRHRTDIRDQAERQ